MSSDPFFSKKLIFSPFLGDFRLFFHTNTTFKIPFINKNHFLFQNQHFLNAFFSKKIKTKFFKYFFAL
ncbi:hypothetical protein BWI92_00680 [Flectobacillus sp. BAB-3569]|nr:hypothetical protein BWI92_00680 [Flectobacillus sp. BAB-3569]